jgi:hypothetical protein
MMAKTEDGQEDRPPGRNTTVLWALLGLLAVCFSVSNLLVAKALWGSPQAWQPLGALAADLLVVGAIWALSRLRPSILKAVMLSALLASMAFRGFSATVIIFQVLVGPKALPRPGETTVFLVLNLLIGLAAVGSWLWLKPWTGWQEWKSEPVSPATRRANKLFGLKELLGVLAMLALFVGASSKDHPFAGFSNSPVPLWIAIVAIASWLLARGLRELWGGSTDEHEQRSLDFGRRVAAGLFFAITPAWWVAARAGLAPQPDVMILWLVTNITASIAWTWRRSR